MNTKRYKKKNYQKRSKSRSQKASPVAWLIGGVLVGLLIPSLFYLKSHTSESVKNAPSDTNISIAVAEEDHPITKKSKSDAPKKVHSKIVKESSKNPQYEFYNLLSSEENAGAAKDEIADIPISKFVLEITQFNRYEEADQLKAQLILMGIDKVLVLKNNKKGASYKVISGPFNTRDEAAKVKQQLKDNAINSTLVVG